jgi:hypothetical protein
MRPHGRMYSRCRPRIPRSESLLLPHIQSKIRSHRRFLRRRKHIASSSRRVLHCYHSSTPRTSNSAIRPRSDTPGRGVKSRTIPYPADSLRTTHSGFLPSSRNPHPGSRHRSPDTYICPSDNSHSTSNTRRPRNLPVPHSSTA